MPATNWAQNLAYRSARVHRPSSVADRTLVSARQVRALGTRHCFNDLADGPGTLVALDGLPPSVQIDPDTRTVTVSAAPTRYGTLAQELHEAGWALGNLASLPHISVAGAIATATHGSGEPVAEPGRRRGRTGPRGRRWFVALRTPGVTTNFAGSVVALGALGIAVEVTLDIEPTYEVAQEVHEDLPWDAALGQPGRRDLPAPALSACSPTGAGRASSRSGARRG